MEMLKEYRPLVGLPPQVCIIQDVGGSFGKGSTIANGIDSLVARARAYIEEFKPHRAGAITHKHMQKEMAEALSLPLERVLYFGNARGSNALRDVDGLWSSAHRGWTLKTFKR